MATQHLHAHAAQGISSHRLAVRYTSGRNFRVVQLHCCGPRRRPAAVLSRRHMMTAAALPTKEKLEVQPMQPSEFIQERMEFLRRDLVHLFDGVGIDKSAYEEKVDFMDPLTNYNTLTGYLFNISFLRVIFGPKFHLHDLRQSGEYEITSRWTMRMSLQPNKVSPLRKWWDPELVFTGISIMALNPDTKRFKSHIDYWDAIENQKFLSLEAVRHLVSQLTTFSQAPQGLDTPDYLVMRKFADCEVRRYEPFTVAETDMESSSGRAVQGGGGSGSGGGGAESGSQNGSGSKKDKGRVSAFRRLAGYILSGDNERQEQMAMTTPVFSSGGCMQFVVGKADKDVADLPSPTDSSVQLKRQPGGHFAAIGFSGVADEQQVQEQLRKLRKAMAAHGLKAKSDDYVVARYNDPGTKSIFRRNDVLIELEDFQLW